MSIVDGALPRAGASARFTFDGRAHQGVAGESIAAAMIAAGEHGFRRTRDGRARGVFCGMGVCQECLVVIDGCPGQRACMTKLADGMTILGQPYRAPVEARPYPTAAEAPRAIESCELLVIGGGAGGLAAARIAACAGVDVVLVDERGTLGGQYYKQRVPASAAAIDRQMGEGRALIEAAIASGVRVISDALVWGAFATQEIAIAVDGATRVLAPRRVILAQGAYERGVPLPGWTLPGVMTTGAVQTLLRAHGVAPGKRVLLAGNGPLNFQVAAELQRAGVAIVAVVEAAPPPWRAAPRDLLAMLRAAPGLVRDGMRDLARLRVGGARILHRHVLIAIEGEDRARAAIVAPVDDAGGVRREHAQRFAADAICMGYGFHPQAELARALGCRYRWSPSRDGVELARADDGATGIDDLWVVGDAGGLGGARAARAQGALAGAAVARSLARAVPAALDAELARARAELAAARSFQAALWSMFRAPPPALELAMPDTIVCRCEEVTLAEIDEAATIAGGAIGAVKLDTRLGMGRCQGRYCAPLLAQRLRAGGAVCDDDPLFAPRAPAKPVPLAAIARREVE